MKADRSPELGPELWPEVDRLFEQALEVEPSARAAFLDRVCKDEPTLRAELETLLAADAEPADYLDRGAAALVAPAWNARATDPGFPGPGVRLGPYRLVEEIGRGGMSVVFLAEHFDERVHRRVAVKVLSTTGWSRPEMERRFRAEGLVLSSLSHPHIAQLLDTGVDAQGRPFLVMEHVDGAPITDHCGGSGLSLDRRLALFLDVCAAVQHAHQRLIVHRDLKPNNILVDGEGRAKLLDFGIAKLLDPEASELTHGDARTGTGLLPMTPEYAAPEQVRAEQITTATDVYALGLLLFELLTGRRAYRLEGRSPGEIEQVVCHEQPPRPSTVAWRDPLATGPGSDPGPALVSRRRLRDELRGDLDTIVLKALRKEPAGRYASAEALAEDLRRYREGWPIHAQPPSRIYRVRKFAGRHRFGLAAATLALLATAAFGFAMSGQQQETARQRDRAQRESEKAQQVTEFLLGLFAASDPAEALGEEITARQLLEGGAQRVSEMDRPSEFKVQMLSVLGRVYGSLGNFERASSLLRQALEIKETLAEEETLTTAGIQGQLADVLSKQGDYAAAESLWRSSLRIRERLLGRQHVEVASTLNDLAVTLKEQGKPAEAEAPSREALSIRREAFGNDHPEVAESLLNLGVLLHALGRHQEAEPPLREALAILTRTRDPLHPRIADAANALGNLLARTSRGDEAEPLLRQALDLRQRVLGADHPAVAQNLNDLATLLVSRGDHVAATPFMEQALVAYERLLGPDHLAVGIVAGNIAELRLLAGQPSEAETLYRRYRQIAERALEPENPYVVKALNGIAAARHAKGDVRGAERDYREAVRMGHVLFDERDPVHANSMAGLGRLLTEIGRLEEAEILLGQAHEVFSASFGQRHTRTARAAIWLGVCRTRLGQGDAASAFVAEALDVQRTLLPPGHPHILESERVLARLRAAPAAG